MKEECTQCDTDNITKQCVSQFFDKKLLCDVPVDGSLKFRKYECCDFPHEIQETKVFNVLSSEMESMISEMSFDELHIMAETVAECMLASYKQIVLDDLKKIWIEHNKE